jgi:hypothetical protein
MSSKYPGGVISKTAPVPSGPYADSTAPGIWTLEQQAAYAKLGQWPTAGNVNPSAFIENLFSTYLYTGTGAAQTITNGIDLSTNGGLVWAKQRDGVTYHQLRDTVRGGGLELYSNDTSGQLSSSAAYTFLSTGYSIGGNDDINLNTKTYASWTFREQAKFFDVVTYTGNGTAGRTVAHNLGSVPGVMIVKRTSSAANWQVYHRSLGATKFLFLNGTDAELTSSNRWNDTTPTSTNFTLGDDAGVNGPGSTYVAYLFAHDAGGFGTSGSDNVISCGSYTGTASTDVTVNLGYEPQWVMIKRTNSTSSPNWWIGDTMRGLNMQGINRLEAWDSAAEGAAYNGINPTSTGFVLPTGTVLNDGASSTYIYIAIRRGPMAVPTLGTSVFSPFTFTGNGTTTSSTTNFPVDLMFDWTNADQRFYWMDRVRGAYYLQSNATAAEILGNSSNGDAAFDFANNTQAVLICPRSGFGNTNKDTQKQALYALRRAPSVLDVVFYTGTGVARTLTHNLAVVPEFMIVKVRSTSGVNWSCYHSALGNTQVISLNEDIQAYTATQWNNTTPTASVFSVGTQTNVNGSGQTYAAYLFATCAGVSKVGSYTGNAGNTVVVPCGFTAGVRFVMIKRTDEVASGNPWYVWDSARGIVAGNDPYLQINAIAAETAGTDYVDTYAAGFEVTSTAPSSLNATGGTYIFLAIA